MSMVLRSAFITSVVGGVVASVGAFLSWSSGGLSITGPLGTSTEEGTTTSSGIEIAEGKVIFAVGILVVAAAIARVLLKGRATRRVAGLVILAGAVAMLFVAINEVVAISGSEGFTISGLTESGEEVTIGSETKVGIGLWLTIAAGVLAAAGAVLTFLGSRATPEPPPTPAPDEA